MTKVPLTANNSIPTHTSTPGRCSLPNSRRPRPAPLRGSHAAAASPPLDPCPTQSDARRSEPPESLSALSRRSRRQASSRSRSQRGTQHEHTRTLGTLVFWCCLKSAAFLNLYYSFYSEYREMNSRWPAAHRAERVHPHVHDAAESPDVPGSCELFSDALLRARPPRTGARGHAKLKAVKHAATN